jgi:hypothetical protein
MAIAMLLYNMTAPLVSGIPQGESHDVSVIAEFMHSTAQNTENTETIRLAENEGSAPNGKDESRATSENEIGKSASESGSGKSEQSKKAKSKPLEPFVPSEEIAAEQAVDFPVDI